MSLKFGQIFVGSFDNIGEEKVKKNSAVEDAGAEVDEHRGLKKNPHTQNCRFIF